jgi:hypothetical protein
MDTLLQVRSNLFLAFLSLPMLLMSLIFFLAIGLGNVGLFVLFLGHALMVPLLLLFTHGILGMTSLYGSPSLYKASSDVSQLVPSVPHALGLNAPVAPSFWMAHMTFFMGYLLANAVGVFRIPQDKKTSDYYFENRKAKAVTIMVLTIFLSLILAGARWWFTDTETLPGVVIAFLTSGALGFGWYQFAEVCGARHADVFGVVPQLLPANAKAETALTCAFAPKP